MHVRLLLLKSVSSVVKLVVGAAISVRKVSSLVPSHLFSVTLQPYEAVLNSPSSFIIPSVSPGLGGCADNGASEKRVEKTEEIKVEKSILWATFILV